MKIIAVDHDWPSATLESFQRHTKEDAARARELHQPEATRELYFRADQPEGLPVLEWPAVAAAQPALSPLPLVRHGLITFGLIPLVAHPGFARLFAAGAGLPGAANHE